MCDGGLMSSDYVCCGKTVSGNLGCAGSGGIGSLHGNNMLCRKSSGGCIDENRGGGGGGSTVPTIKCGELTLNAASYPHCCPINNANKCDKAGEVKTADGTQCGQSEVCKIPPPTCTYSFNYTGGCNGNCGQQGTWDGNWYINNKPCDEMYTTVPPLPICTVPACVPCDYGDWQDTSTCPECGTGLSKNQKQTAKNPGCNGPNERYQSIPCNINPCPTCNYGNWTDWTPCSKPCNGGTVGTQTRTRTEKPYGSIQCGDTSQTQQCNTQACPPCEYSTKGTTSECSVECGGGTQTTTYDLKDAHGNETCNTTKVDTKICNTIICATIMNVIVPTYTEYWNVYLMNNYNSASYFTSADYNKIDNSHIISYKINSQNAEKYRDSLVVSMFPLTIDIINIPLPYTVYYYYNNPANGVAKITNNGTAVTSLQLNCNKNNLGTVINAIHFNTNGLPSIVHSQMYFLTSDFDTTDFDIYMVVSKTPIVVQPKQLLSCTAKNAAKCIDNNLGSNMAVAFTINLKGPNQTTNRLQILGITTDPTGIEKCVFGAWLCPNSSSLYLRRADVAGTPGVFSECNIDLDIGLDCQIFMLFNGSTETYDVYKNGLLMDSFTVTSPPMYASGKSYVFTSFNNYQTVNGSLSNVVFLTSPHRTFTVGDLENAVQYMNTGTIFSKYQKSLIEGFSEIPVTNYQKNFENKSNDILINILWATLASSIIYFLFCNNKDMTIIISFIILFIAFFLYNTMPLHNIVEEGLTPQQIQYHSIPPPVGRLTPVFSNYEIPNPPVIMTISTPITSPVPSDVYTPFAPANSVPYSSCQTVDRLINSENLDKFKNLILNAVDNYHRNANCNT